MVQDDRITRFYGPVPVVSNPWTRTNIHTTHDRTPQVTRIDHSRCDASVEPSLVLPVESLALNKRTSFFPLLTPTPVMTFFLMATLLSHPLFFFQRVNVARFL